MPLIVFLLSPGGFGLVSPSRWPPLAARIGLVIVLATLVTLVAPPGKGRRALGGYFFATAVFALVFDYGGRVGLHLPWQRLLAGLALFLLLYTLTNPPDYVKRPLDRWKARRKRA